MTSLPASFTIILYILFGALLSVCLLLSLPQSAIVGQEIVSGVPATRIRAMANAPAVRVNRFNPGTAGFRKIVIRLDERSLRADTEALAQLRSLPPGVIEKVDYVTAECSNSVRISEENADLRRLEGLYTSEPALFTGTYRLGRIVQTGCQFDYETQGWFRGLVVTTSVSFTAGNDESDLNPERLQRVREFEYKEGDWLKEARAYNSKGTPRPPVKFRKGTARPIKFDSKRIQTVRGGYSIDLGTDPLVTPTLCDGRLYTGNGTHGTQFHAFDMQKNGAPKVRWSVALNDMGPSRAVCGNKTVAFNTYSCTLFVLNSGNGKELWSYFLGDILPSAPTIVDGTVYTTYPSKNFTAVQGPNSPTHVMAAFGERDGRILWQRWIDSDSMDAPLINGSNLFLTTFSGLVYTFSLKGKLQAARRNRATGIPVIRADGRRFFLKRADGQREKTIAEALAISSAGGEAYQVYDKRPAPYLDARQRKSQGYAADFLNPESAYVHVGRKSWDGMQSYDAQRIVAQDDILYVASGNHLSAYDVSDETPDRIWSVGVKTTGANKQTTALSAPVVVGDRIYTALGKTILELDAEDGSTLRKLPIGARSAGTPVYDAASDTLSVATDAGKLFILQR